MNSLKKEKMIKHIKIVGIVFMYLLMSLIIAITNHSGDRIRVINNVDVNSGSICGIYAVVQLMLAILLVMNFRKRGYIVASSLYGFSFLSLCCTVFERHKYDSLPGMAMVLGGIITINILHYCLNKIDKNEQGLIKNAYTDSLTGLPNRRSLTKTLNELIDHNKSFALVFIDLDNFKNINDTMGHEYGDEVLRVITSRWQGMRRKTDFVSRMGGDEFALIIAGSPNENNNAEIADKYMSMLDDKIEVMNHSFYVTASMGVAFYPVDCQNAAELLRFADTAMYNAKHNGKSRICIFNKEQMLEMEESVKLENLLRKAIDNDLFYLKFQPQFSTEDKILRGFETVIRLNDESGNAVSPQIFIPAAENLNLIVDIDRWVLANAMKTGKTLISNNPDIKISINISVKHIFDDSFLSDIENNMEKYDFPAENLEIEVTESLFISSVKRAGEILSELKRLGIYIALDDFGTGFASLSYLNTLPIDLLKIDKSFIDKLSEKGRNNDFVNAIISMGHLLNFEVISEGVESKEQLATLRDFNCDYIQGYIWGKPMLLADANKLIIENAKPIIVNK